MYLSSLVFSLAMKCQYSRFLLGFDSPFKRIGYS